MNEYYKILGLAPGATQVEIKRAYRKLALKYHPDRNKTSDAREQFIRIANAYEILSNPPKAAAPRATPNYSQRAAEERLRREEEMKKREFRRRYAAHKRKRELEQNRAYSQGIAITVGMVLLVLAFVFGISLYEDWKLNQDPAETIAMVVNYNNQGYKVVYEVEGETFVHFFSGSKSRDILRTPNGMPVVVGAEFVVKYSISNPDLCEVNYEMITPKTLQLYVDMVRFPISELMEIPEKDQRLACLALQTYNEFGIDGLSNLYFCDEAFVENFSNNSTTFGRMLKKPDFQQIIKNCLLTLEMSDY